MLDIRGEIVEQFFKPLKDIEGFLSTDMSVMPFSRVDIIPNNFRSIFGVDQITRILDPLSVSSRNRDFRYPNLSQKPAGQIVLEV